MALSLTALLMPPYIKWLKALNIDQQLREEGPKSHAHKAKTPTMGGLCFLATTAVCSAALAFYPLPKAESLSALFVIVIGVLCGVVGLLDDGAKVRQKANRGISARLRLGTETVLGIALSVALVQVKPVTLILPASLAAVFGQTLPAVNLPSAIVTLAQADPHFYLAIPALLVILLGAFLTAATTNAVNLHDGMDGLAAGTGTQVFATLAVMLFDAGEFGYATISATAAMALLGFLIYNKNPARIFMGDTGSLFIGGLMASLVLAGGLTLYFIPLSLIYIVEALSVMAQVTYFKLTKPFKPEKPMSAPALAFYKLTRRLPGEGKRLFRMAPLHHHFEAVLTPRGWAEWQVVAAFWAVQALLCLVTLFWFEVLK
ncbi:MAG: phospho-N-acetylmuramoyl-pentapeptide-transferase [Cyanobacteria bacterium REEB67]|nr:phospho-N-acetylmuramoyl-pentapeptide-transferase [Cyanobacteria bacterium REEB67]